MNIFNTDKRFSNGWNILSSRQNKIEPNCIILIKLIENAIMETFRFLTDIRYGRNKTTDCNKSETRYGNYCRDDGALLHSRQKPFRCGKAFDAGVQYLGDRQ